MKKSKLICLLISLLASIFLWVYVVTVVSPEMTQTFYDIPVTFYGEDVLAEQGLAITKGYDSTIDLRVTGKRTVVTQLNSDNITVTVDVSKVKSAGDFSRNYTITYPNSIQPSSLTIERKTPSSISFTVEELVTKEIPVKAVFQGSVADGYMLETVTPAYDSISVTGTKERLKNIESAMIFLNSQNLNTTTTVNMSYTLVDANGTAVDTEDLQMDTDMVSVTIAVAKYKEIPLTVEFTAGAGATESNASFTVDPPTITVSGDEKVLNEINKIVIGTVDLSKVNGESEVKYPIVLPDNVKNESGVAEATATVSISGVDSAKIKVTDFEFVNVPAGFVAQAVTESLQITVRGPSADIAKISSSNLRVMVDLSDLEAKSGDYTVNNVTVTLDGYPNSGVLGSYNVALRLITEAEYVAAMTEPLEGE